MGTGILSIDLSLEGRETLSRIMLAIGVAAWLLIGLVLSRRLIADPERVRREMRSPAALTGVAGTAVLGSRLTLLGSTWAGIALLMVAAALWLALLGPVLRHWAVPTVGVSLMLTVSSESLAVLLAALAAHEGVVWLLYAACVPFVLGLGSYAFVMSRFDLRQLTVGQGDHWITGGALGIAALAAGRITLGAKGLHVVDGGHDLLAGVSLTLWALTIAWLPVLLVVELLRPRLRYDIRRWATVFPVGMYAACSFVVGTAVRAPGISDFARIWLFAGIALWLIVFLGTARRAVQVARGPEWEVTGSG